MGPVHELQGRSKCYLAVLLICAHVCRSHACAEGFTENSPADVCDLLRHLEWTRFVVQRVLTPCLVICGILGNITNIAVLTHRTMRHSSTNIYLCALALFDILYLLFAFSMSLKHYESIKNSDTYILYSKSYGKPIVDTCSNTTVWLTLTFTIERYIGVCLPMKGKKWCTAKRARFVTVVVCVATTIITFPEFFEYEVAEKYVVGGGENATNATVLYPELTRFGRLQAYQWGYVYMNQALFTFLPLVLLIAFNVLLARAVVSAAHKRKFMTGLIVLRNKKQEKQNREQQRITIMLISVVIVFLICQMPQAVMNLYITYLTVAQNGSTRTMLVVTILNNVFNLLVLLNSTLNFVLYSCFSTKYRQTFRQLFCELRGDKMPVPFLNADQRVSISMPTQHTYLSSRRFTMPALMQWNTKHAYKQGAHMTNRRGTFAFDRDMHFIDRRTPSLFGPGKASLV